jgi:BirA family biotin operon repressor/biotin-[acetyl-CoA-carboxylase] ligase
MNYKLIKLDATTSTNDFLKSMNSHVSAGHFTVVRADYQTKGKGQMGATWTSEKGKNLIMSILVKEKNLTLENVYDLNRLVSVSLVQALLFLKIPNLSVKWPNDIMSGNKKIAGILIENIIKSNQELESIIGIGLNVNQTEFNNLTTATSMNLETHKKYDLDKILDIIVQKLDENIKTFSNQNTSNPFNELYDNYLFKKNIPSVFQTQDEQKFMGIIQKVTPSGLLEVLLEDDTLKHFDIKQVKMIF